MRLAPQAAPGGHRFLWQVAGWAALVGIFFLHLAMRTSDFFPVDDAYISFRYAANLAQGDGLVFNPGERVEGYSNFLFVVSLAAASELGITPPLAARWINIASVVFLAWVMTFGLRRVHPGLGWLAGLFLVLSPHTILNVLSGLEAPATAALLAAGVFFLDRNQLRPAAVSFLLVALSRPEGIVLALLAAAFDLCRGWDHARQRIRSWLLLLAVPYTIFFVWRVAYYGSMLPNSVHAKSGFAAAVHLRRTLSYMAPAVDFYWPLLLLAVIGLVAGRRRFPRRGMKEGSRRWVPGGAWVLFLGVIGLCLLTGSGDPYLTYVRYLYPGLPLLLMVASASAQGLLRRAAARGRRPLDGVLGVVAAFLLASQVVVVAERAGFELLRLKPFRALARLGAREKIAVGLAQIFAQDRAPHTSDRLRVAIGQHDLARWLLDHADRDAVLVSSQVGIAPYYTGLRVVDTFGLVTKHIAELPGPPGAKKDSDFVFGQDPDFFAFRKPRSLIGGTPADAELFRNPRLRLRYDLVRMFSLGGPRLLLFQRRGRPVFDIHYDFFEQFSRRRVGFMDGESWRESGDGPDRKRVGRHWQVQFYDKKKRKKLRRALRPVIRVVGTDFQGADAMRRWQEQWRSWIEHRAEPGRLATAIRYRVEVPDGAFLRFGLGAPARNRDRGYAGAARYSIVVEDEEPMELFSALRDPARKPAHRRPRHFEIDLRSFAGREITFYFRANRVAERPERGGWIEPMIVRYAEKADLELSADRTAAGEG